MKILHVSTADNSGGSARSAYKIHQALRAKGHSSSMFVSIKVTKDPDVHYLAGNKLFQRADKLLGRAVDQTGLQNFGYLTSLALPFRRLFREADIVQLYNVHHYYFNQFTPLLFGKKPIVWRLSDQWAMTGHCAYSYSCEKWETGCGGCPALDEYDPLPWDTSALLWRTKNRVYANMNAHVVAPSRWIEGLARRSPILNRFPIHYIPNGIDTDIYRPQNKSALRAELGIPHDSIVLLFSAQGLFSERKGGSYVLDAIRAFPENIRARLFLLLVGDAGQADFAPGVPFKIVSEYKNEHRLAGFYAAADIGIFPSTAENLPNSVLECMACGVPCVSFRIGGITDAVIDGKTGILVEPKDVPSLRDAIKRLFEQPALRAEMALAARRLVEERFTIERQGHEFEALYGKILRCAG